MSKTNHKHTPLSSEELLELLNTKTSDEILLSDLDDFEKEALEGFMGESTPEASKKMMREVESRIEQRLVVKETPSKKNRVIWLSMAASIVLIIGLSVFFLKEAKQQEKIALNELSDKSQQFQLEVVPDNLVNVGNKESATEIANSTVPEGRNAKFLKLEEKSSRGISSSEDTDERFKNSAHTTKANNDVNLEQESASAKTIEFDALADNTKEKSYNKGGLEGYNNVKDSEVSTKFQKATDKNTVSNAPVAPTVVANNMTSAPNEVGAEMKKKKSEVKDDAKAGDQVSDAISYTTTSRRIEETTEKVSRESSYSVGNAEAYYRGGDTELKKYVQYYNQKINSRVLLKGTYHIKGLVYKDGTFKVLSIVNSTKDCPNCESTLESILNKTTEWQPALKNGKNSDSEVNFELIF